MKDRVILTGGVSFSGILFFIFLILKLCGIGVVATWSWWWVTAPLWIGAALTIAIFILIFLITIIATLIRGLFH